MSDISLTTNAVREIARLLREGASNTENSRDMAENVPEYAMGTMTQDACAHRAWAMTLEGVLSRAF